MVTAVQRLDLVAAGPLEFEAPDEGRFPSLRLARQVLEEGGAAPIVLNAANEIAVAAFLNGGIHFPDIAGLVEAALQMMNEPAPDSIADVLAIDSRTRAAVSRTIAERVT
jgi:1-deoxy-D-xylulose-5-phosphate reductoisomerase